MIFKRGRLHFDAPHFSCDTSKHQSCQRGKTRLDSSNMDIWYHELTRWTFRGEGSRCSGDDAFRSSLPHQTESRSPTVVPLLSHSHLSPPDSAPKRGALMWTRARSRTRPPHCNLDRFGPIFSRRKPTVKRNVRHNSGERPCRKWFKGVLHGYCMITREKQRRRAVKLCHRKPFPDAAMVSMFLSPLLKCVI